ncbi:hexose transporter hxt5 [Friedmanniomyces endolithicus]|uniref:Hexose transporter hxt5 n=1 Tax=Friedmanniomyces endolithicus TaxID=329885 RepID=A0AAN6L0N2_9PEZI|nr:hexose transporter hxt5 [Friedmanniomyces endolithicus]KAK0975625.1 hexose transporter hxt5 [Friedmanniomyces endolithicus]KAK1011647.1 hexose transporter hxt5 [Friedmanniomyces endolithicus]KAK1054908.1 hexose transporter hxt5 [Friedmanniomyces endolithicus]
MPQIVGMPMSFLDWIDTYRVFHGKKSKQDTANATVPSGETTPRQETGGPDPTFAEKAEVDNSKIRLLRPRIFAMALIVSIGGLIFGYDTGQISGFLAMDDFLTRFGNEPGPAFSNVRSGTIVGLLSIGTLIGAIGSAPIADIFGRRVCIVTWCLVFCVGVIIQISTEQHWYQLAIGRWVAGLGVGGLSVLTPMYQSETAPRQVRGALVSCYQLFITFGIWLAYMINFGSHTMAGSSQWKLPMGIGFIFPAIMATGICFLRESPRWDYRHGKIDAARTTIAKSYGVSESHYEVQREMREIKEKFDAENAGGGKHRWYEAFTGPRMAYRTCLGVALQALQQLTGANFFFYYGTTVFAGIGLSDSFVTSIILGTINFAMTFPGLYVVEHFGRRRALIAGALWMFMCFMIFASIGHFLLEEGRQTKTAGTVMIIFTAIFIAGYAMTWGPIVWAVIGEMFPTRYRATCMGISSASNWIWNFLISFFTPFITSAIDYRYGYVFAACCFTGALVVYFFLCESSGRSLEEIDTMYIMHVPPTKSTKWIAPEGEELVTADRLFLEPGARNIRKEEAAGMETAFEREEVPMANDRVGVSDVSGSWVPEASGGRGG